MASTVTTRWRGQLKIRQGLLLAAERRLAYRRRRHAYYHSAAAKRAYRGRDDERQALATKWHKRVDEATADVITRRAQVAFAKRVLARHATPAVSTLGAEFIAAFEGGASKDGLFRPYWDAHGRVWTIGYGHTRGVGPKSKPLTRAQAIELLRRDLDEVYAPPVIRAAKTAGLRLSQNELDALVSFAYNLGPGAVTDTGAFTMARAIRARDRKAIAAAFLLYDKAGGKRLAGLTRRRKAERALFLG